MDTTARINRIGGFAGIAALCLGGILGLTNPSTWHLDHSASAWDGSWAVRYEDSFDNDLSFRSFATDLWGVIAYAVFDQGRYGVLIGRDNWLFTSEEYELAAHRTAETDAKLALIGAVRDRLAADGIGLVVAVVPAKARVMSDYLDRYPLPSYVVPAYDGLQAALRAAKVDSVDLLAPLNAAKATTQVFLKTDTHWTPAGAEVAARAIAATVATRWPDLMGPADAFVTRPGAEIEHKGDLLRYIPLGVLQDDMGPQPDRFVQPETEATAAGDDAGGLLGDTAVNVTLVGSSYSANPLWNFTGALKQALGTDVINAAEEGKGAFQPMLQYLASPAFQEAKPKLVIWEIPERQMQVHYDLPPVPGATVPGVTQ